MANEEHIAILRKGVQYWNTWRKANPDVKPDLGDRWDVESPKGPQPYIHFNDLDLSMIDLSYTNLDGLDFHRTKFIGANLYEAVLGNAGLYDADFTNADLTGVELYYASLEGARLSGAYLGGVFFYRSWVDGTDFSGCRLYETQFIDTDLSLAIGLDNCKMEGPCVLDTRTIQKSQKIPLKFLRGCGLPDVFIDYIPSLFDQPIQFYSCFISYSHDDKLFAQRLHDQLQEKGIRCWLDEHKLLPGDDIYTEVDKAIKQRDKVLLCCSKSSLTSWWVDNEISTAFSREQKLMKERGQKIHILIPLNIDGFLFSNDCLNRKAPQIRERLSADFTNWETDKTKFNNQLERVVLALRNR